MDALIIESAGRLPAVSLVAETGKLLFSGRSLPEDGRGFYLSIVSWMEHYSLNPAPKTECSFRMEYFNSSSRKCFTDIFKLLSSMHEKGNAVKIIWYHEEVDDEMRDMGEWYQNIFKLDFQFRSY